MRQIRVLKAEGSYHEIGFQHGRRYRSEILQYTEERISLVEDGTWSGGIKLNRSDVLALAEACIPEHEAYAPELMEEMRGMAEGGKISIAELIVVNGFTDFLDTVYDTFNNRSRTEAVPSIDDCTAFLVPDQLSGGSGFFGQTWDMHETAVNFVIMLHLIPEEDPAILTFTTTGCLGQIGLNEHGIAVGINNLSGADGQIGVTWPFVVRKVLQQNNIDDALACITKAKLAGAHNYMLFDRLGNGFNVEAMSTNHTVTVLNDRPIVHTNHCLRPENLALSQTKLPASQRHSERRWNKASERLNDAQRPITVGHLQELTREFPICTPAGPLFHASTCGAALMRPKTGEMWVLWGVPSENEYERFQIGLD